MQYFAITAFLAMLAPALREPTRRTTFVLAGLLAAFAAANMESSWDYLGYVDYFRCAADRSCAYQLTTVEPTYVLMARFWHMLLGGLGAPVLVAAYSTMGVFAKVFFLRTRCEQFGVALLYYGCYGFVLHEMTQIRVGLALAAFWLAAAAVSERRSARGTAWTVVAALLHYSTVACAAVFAVARIDVTLRRFVIVAAGCAAVGALMATSRGQEVTLALLAALALGQRAGIYSAAIGSEVLSLSRFNVASIVTLVLVAASLRHHADDEWTAFEQLSVKLVAFGVCFYFAFSWVPVIGLRVFEIFASLTPVLGAALYRTTKSRVVAAVILLIPLLMWYNLVVRNGIRLDFVLPGQAQERWL